MDTIDLETTISASKSKAWNTLADFGGIDKWASGITNSKSLNESDTNIGTERTFEIPQIGTLREKIIDWNEGNLIKYEIAPIPNTPVRYATSNWTVSEHGDQSVVHLTSEYDLVGSKEQKEEFLKNTTDFLILTLQDLKQYVEKQ